MDAVLPARLVVSLYDYADGEQFAWDHQATVSNDAGVFYGLKRVGGITYVVFRGTDTPIDFVRDAEAYTAYDPDLGSVYAGFLRDMRATASYILSRCYDPLVVVGHSLGAMRANVFCGLAKIKGAEIIRRVTFGEPWGCGQHLANLIADIPAAAYCAISGEDRDPVTELPPQIGPIFDYFRPSPLIDLPVTVTAAARADLPLCPLHYSPGYLAGVKALEAAHVAENP